MSSLLMEDTMLHSAAKRDALGQVIATIPFPTAAELASINANIEPLAKRWRGYVIYLHDGQPHARLAALTEDEAHEWQENPSEVPFSADVVFAFAWNLNTSCGKIVGAAMAGQFVRFVAVEGHSGEILGLHVEGGPANDRGTIAGALLGAMRKTS